MTRVAAWRLLLLAGSMLVVAGCAGGKAEAPIVSPAVAFLSSTGPEERPVAIDRLRREISELPLHEQIAAVRILDLAWAESMEEARECFDRPRQPTFSTNSVGERVEAGFFESCPYVYLSGTVEEVEADLGSRVLQVTDQAYRLYDVQRILFNPRVGDDPALSQRAIITWHRDGSDPTVVTLRIGLASSGQHFMEQNRDADSSVTLADGTPGILHSFGTNLDGSPFAYPWQEQQVYLVFIKEGLFYQLTGANLTREEAIRLADSME